MVCLHTLHSNILKKNLKNSCLIGILLPYLGINKQIKVMELLNKAKAKLINRTIDMFIDRREDIEIVEYPEHFSNMGEMIARIDSLQSISSVIESIEAGSFNSIALFDDDVEDFLESLLIG